VGDWMAARADEVGERVSRQPGVAEVCEPDAVKALFKNTSKQARQAAWTLLFYALWHQCHILGAETQGDVLETLGTAA